MTPVEVLEKRRDELMLDATEAEGFAAQQEANARQYRGTAAERRQQVADIDAAILSLQQPWKAAPVPDEGALKVEIVKYVEEQPSAFEKGLAVAEQKFKRGQKVA
jgi:hypothetical protein